MLKEIVSRAQDILQKSKLKKSQKHGLGHVEEGRVFEYSNYLLKKDHKKALLCYLVQPIIEELCGIKTNQFSNAGAVRAIAKVLNELGYVVDVINWDDTDFIPKKSYDLYFLHGGNVYPKIKNKIPPSSKIIYYSTGSYWKYHNDQELKRFEDFKKRHNKSLTPDRFIRASEEDVNQAADLIISLGNQEAAETYSKFINVVNLEGASIPDKKSIVRNYSVAKNHFLFLSGPGNIHKGLDLLLDTFVNLPEKHLHIVSTMDLDFEEYYHDVLYKSSNIRTYGYVPQRSKQFYDIVKQCSASILPSCSEGSPGSVIESMEQGLIPIVSRESHINLDDIGVILKDCKISTIKKHIEFVSSGSESELQEKSVKVRQFVQKNFSVEKYESKLKKFIVNLDKTK